MTWKNFTEKYQGLTLREKTIMLISGLIMIGFGSFSLILEPQYVAWQQQIISSDKILQTINVTQTQIEQIELKLNQELNRELKEEINQLKQRHQLILKNLSNQQLALVAKTEMADILKTLLQDNSELTLMALRSLEPQPILFTASSSDTEMKEKSPLLFKHTILLDVEGNYFAVVDFLQQIEQANAKILWQSVDYTVLEYPTALVKIEVFTLSTDKEFIGVSY